MLTRLSNRKPRHFSAWIELFLITLFGLWVTKPYLNFGAFVWPYGLEFPSSIQTHFVWTLLPKCGVCILWNGWLNGGAPAFAELHGSLLHPIVIISTLIFGVLNGSKLALVISFILGGWAQWWIAKTLKLGWIARLWSAAMAIVGGQLAGRMELGAFGVVLSVAACSLIIAPGLSTALDGKRRDIVLFGSMVALAMLSGQGYMQAGMLIAMIPAFLIFTVNSQFKPTPVVKKFALAAFIAILLAGIFWVPMVHLWPYIYKDIDPLFKGAQPIQYIPLNLVISDWDFQYSTILGKLPYPSLNSIYIGWIPILLAILALRAPRSKKDIKVFIFFLLSILLVFLTSSAVLLKLLAHINEEVFAGIRNSSQISALSVPYILALSAWGLDWLIKKNWPKLEIKLGTIEIKFSSKLFMIIPLVWAVSSGYNFSSKWIINVPAPAQIEEVAEKMETKYASWVSFPFGEHYWMIAGLDSGLKIGTGISHWEWKNRSNPPSIFTATRDAVDQGAPNFVGQFIGVNIIKHPDVNYAYIENGNQEIPCQAIANGGNIDVNCESAKGGTLVVTENVFSGWNARIDGRPTQLVPYEYWLAVKAPAGDHKYKFRYRPWDVPLGLMLTLIGIGLVLWILFHKQGKKRPPVPSS